MEPRIKAHMETENVIPFAKAMRPHNDNELYEQFMTFFTNAWREFVIRQGAPFDFERVYESTKVQVPLHLSAVDSDGIVRLLLRESALVLRDILTAGMAYHQPHRIKFNVIPRTSAPDIIDYPAPSIFIEFGDCDVLFEMQRFAFEALMPEDMVLGRRCDNVDKDQTAAVFQYRQYCPEQVPCETVEGVLSAFANLALVKAGGYELKTVELASRKIPHLQFAYPIDRKTIWVVSLISPHIVDTEAPESSDTPSDNLDAGIPFFG